MAKFKLPHQKGFTIIEVMIVLGISGLILIGALGGTYSSIERQRYSDAVRSFAEDLRREYNEVLNPRSNGDGRSDAAVYGKAIVFGLEDNKVYSTLLIGDTSLPQVSSGFLSELIEEGVHFSCDVSEYNLNWQTMEYSPPASSYKGKTIIIARTPSSGMVHTAVRNTTFDIRGTSCNSASVEFMKDLKDNTEEYKMNEPTTFCITSDKVKNLRAVEITADGKNTSAVRTLDETETVTRCK